MVTMLQFTVMNRACMSVLFIIHATEGFTMTDAEIIDLFDYSYLTLSELSQLSGRSVGYLKELLLA
jgi:hypothetical protein